MRTSSDSSGISRRDVLRTGGAALGVAGVGQAAPAMAQRGPLKMRGSIHAMDANDINLQAYIQAVAEMKRRSDTDPNDPMGWEAQARIHEQFCPHGNWYFLPWHRAYLIAFEEVCRTMSDEPNFALPYWDWMRNPDLPAAFTDPASPLFEASRTGPPGGRLTDPVFEPAAMAAMLNESNYEVFGSGPNPDQRDTSPRWQRAQGSMSGLELGPHNQVHIDLGGIMNSMLSPRDPIFWLHHCNIDRLWAVWNVCGKRNTTEANWLNFTFRDNFLRGDGQRWTVAVRELQLINPWGYSYGEGASATECPATTADLRLARLEPNWRERARAVPVGREAKTSAPVSVALPRPAAPTSAPRGAAKPGARETFQLPATGAIPSRVVAIISDVTPPADADTQVRVFVNLRGANAQTPVSDPHYVGTISFFGTIHGPQGHAGHEALGAAVAKPSFVFDLTQPLARLKAAGQPVSGDVEIQLVPVSRKDGPGKDVAVTVGKVEISGNRT